MKYRDLIQFEPIKSIVVLKDSVEDQLAQKLVDTYVISDRMAEVIDSVIIEQLQFQRPIDHKGIMVVGNYGTGKSHLMSVIAAISETNGISDHIQHKRIAQKAKEIEGKFKVLRVEFDGIVVPLREVLFQEMTRFLQDLGVDYEMPDLLKLTSNKDEMMRMMAAFHEVYPDHGFLLIIDELLDYLRTRKEQELILDLGFLRALGEICQNTRFRFMTGVQEMLFDNPKFQFVAAELRRVKERTVQAIIVREDIEYVVSQRLLRKDDRQKALIREHLQKFAPLFEKLGEQIEKYAELFPIHPAYLSAFEKVKIAEKRVALTTISQEIEKLLDTEVPSNSPGVISYDNYWLYIEGDRNLRNDVDVKEVMDKSAILFDRIENAFPKAKASYKPMAKRVVRALSVFRLTTDDIKVKIGVTSTELRDQLFLYIDFPDIDSDFLNATIDTVLNEIMKSVSYQFISFNRDNGQYYLDLDKDTDVDALIEQKAEMLVNNQLDRYYFEVLEKLTDDGSPSIVSGYRIWQHELNWFLRKVTRPGYLFFGAPNERSTAQPERDFYIYMLQPYDPPKFKDEAKPDEVFFKLDTKDESFHTALHLYAGAREMSITASSATKKLYDDKAAEFLRKLMKWLVENMPSAYKMTYKGVTKKLAEWSLSAPAQATVREIIDAAADDCLTTWFEEKYSDYPTFRLSSISITREAMLKTYIPETLANISNPKTKTARTILEGLVLLDGEKINVQKSGYAKWVLNLLNSKGNGQVLNASELLEVLQSQGDWEVKKTIEFQLEPELLSVILAALVYTGDIVITINGETYDSMKFNQLIALKAEGIAEFSHIKKPSDLPLAELRALFDLFGISHGLLQPDSQTNGVQTLQTNVQQLITQLVKLQHELKDKIPTWELPLLSDEELQEYQSKLQSLNQFLQSLQVFDTPAKLKNFKKTIEEIQSQHECIMLMDRLIKWREIASHITKKANYIVSARNHVSIADDWYVKVEGALEDLYLSLKANSDCSAELQVIDQLKDQYIVFYYAQHAASRLGATEENKLNQLKRDGRIDTLQKISVIPILPAQQLQAWKAKSDDLKICWKLQKSELEHSPVCPHCRYRPKDEKYAQQVTVRQLETELEELLDSWTNTLLTNLNDSELRENIELLTGEQKQLIKQFMDDKSFGIPVDLRLVQTIKEVLEGIQKVELPLNRLLQMAGDGNPLTIEELRLRFEQLVREQVGTQSSNRVRIMLKKE
jgi:predicted ATPase